MGAADAGLDAVAEVFVDVVVGLGDAGEGAVDGSGDGDPGSFRVVGEGAYPSPDGGGCGEFTDMPVVFSAGLGCTVGLVSAFEEVNVVTQLADPVAVVTDGLPVECGLG